MGLFSKNGTWEDMGEGYGAPTRHDCYIDKLCDIVLDRHLEVWVDHAGFYNVKIKGVKIISKTDGFDEDFILDEHGSGRTIEEAAEDYYKMINGKTIIYNRGGKTYHKKAEVVKRQKWILTETGDTILKK